MVVHALLQACGLSLSLFLSFLPPPPPPVYCLRTESSPSLKLAVSTRLAGQCALGILCLPPNARIAGMSSHVQLFTRVLEIQTKVLMFAHWGMFPARAFPFSNK